MERETSRVMRNKGALAVRGAISSTPRHILLVEDSRVNQMVTVALLRKAGYQVDAVDNGFEAIESVRVLCYDLVLMDMAMPKMDGFETTSKIRGLPAPRNRIPIIAITANLPADYQARCLAAGMNDYIPKPINRLRLLPVLERWLTLPKTASCEAALHNAGSYECELDTEVLNQLQADTDLIALRRVIRLFIEETQMRLTVIATAQRIGDWPRLQREAHTLKSSAGAFGARRLQEHARRLDQSCRDGNWDEARALAQSIAAVAEPSLEVLTRQYAPGSR